MFVSEPRNDFFRCSKPHAAACVSSHRGTELPHHTGEWLQLSPWTVMGPPRACWSLVAIQTNRTLAIQAHSPGLDKTPVGL